MNFGHAIEALKLGKKASRSGWNGKGMWLLYIEDEGYACGPTEIENKLQLLPWIRMKTADNKFVPWLASQNDVLAQDWDIVE